MSSETATLEDFGAWLDHHLENVEREIHTGLLEVRSRAAMASAYHSSRTALLEVAAVEKGFRRGVEVALGECKRAGRITSIDRDALRRATEERLRGYLAKMETILPRTGRYLATSDLAPRTLVKLGEHLTFALRHFDVGFLDPEEPNIPSTMNNTVNVAVMRDGMLQQGTTQSSQSAATSFNREAAKEALDAFVEALKGTSVRQDKLAEMQPEIDTIRAQLEKATPSPSILREAGQSLRSIIEGMVAEVLTSPIVEAARKLFHALGFG